MLLHCHRLEHPIDAMQCDAMQINGSIKHPIQRPVKSHTSHRIALHTMMNGKVYERINHSTELMKMLVELIKNACEELH